MTQDAPVIAVVSCRKQLNGYTLAAVTTLYTDAVLAFGGVPVLLASYPDSVSLDQLLARVDGVLLPGSHSNVAPTHYGADHQEPKQDSGRDGVALPLIRLCAEQKIPLFGICRGFQEINVALGGTLDPAVYQRPDALDHREPDTPDFAEKYAHRHSVRIAPDGLLSQWWPDVASFSVNSLHNQGVERLAPALQLEAIAPDGLVEAFSLPDHPFLFGVQWHPEWQATEEPASQLLFERFIQQARQRQGART
ncbi:gamma-glutamyl-gamma-aminobutyrate hydrolase family protein [Ferrimonas marina]|uniref:gamma-glutamyl-gamma-aminobutyrate hydrolase n=1 Tax=Ferrimonas marina TaxID=299255 RepID=A0A1M5YRX1_9GAMM|nr:gamma-glutamyl-gamma-aminobutyrate hydrolase family protein [Ferrimonas marina]SHI14669.1 gamma-glutamyl-gamma-aminobutyrate hydrolase [Ferrimonas marina]